MTTIDYYNANAEMFYQETIGVEMTEFYEKFLIILPDKAKILDAGCGSGRDSLYFKRHGYQVTAIDGSFSLAQLAAKTINEPILNQTFQEIEFENEFDGIWACASLLHVSRNEIDDVINRLAKALKTDGILYASFKYGDEEYEKDGRYFNSYDEESFRELINTQANIEILKVWISNDLRKERNQEKWLNILMIKI